MGSRFLFAAAELVEFASGEKAWRWGLMGCFSGNVPTFICNYN